MISPNEADASPDKLNAIRWKNSGYNSTVKDVVKVGDIVRNKVAVGLFSKEGPKYTKMLYAVVEKVGNKYRLLSEKNVEHKKRLYRANELQLIDVQKVNRTIIL